MKLEQLADELNMDLAEVLDRVVNKRELLIRLLKVYAAGDYMERARQGLKRKDYKVVEENLHSMKGSGASLGLDQVADACHQVVTAIREQRFQEVETLFAGAEKEYKRVQGMIWQLEAK